MWKRKFTVRLPVWCLVIAISVITFSAIASVVIDQRFCDQWFFRHLEYKDVARIEINDSLIYDPLPSVALDRSDAETLISILNDLELDDDPYITAGLMGANPDAFTITMKDGRRFSFHLELNLRPDEYRLWFDDGSAHPKLYYMGPVRETPPQFYMRYRQLYERLYTANFQSEPLF